MPLLIRTMSRYFYQEIKTFIPAVEAVRRLGKQVFVATWNGRGLSPELRRNCFGEVNLGDGRAFFAESNIRFSRRQLADLDTGVSRSNHVAVLSKARPVEMSVADVIFDDKGLGAPTVKVDVDPQAALLALLGDLRDACEHFKTKTGHATEWYFINRWRSQNGASVNPEDRKLLLDVLVDNKKVVRYTWTDDRGFPQDVVRPADG